ncbi:transcription factor ORG2-like [Macadamia integrifolia]|uniref:transcription factor ORG2-like n=1 Tax=Macadamia integrifolia TaxID=60698 RepID=UPI001C501935|nr:transcription factor ORG2-like [Macadamia integrifolia]
MNHNQKTSNEPHINSSHNHRETGSSESFPHLLHSLQPQIDPHTSKPSSTTSGGCGGGDPVTVKKLSHNASERDRRKRLNDLFFSLRSLLPGTDRSKKLSIPGTVTCALKYIPELQKLVQKLMQRKEEILSVIYEQRDDPIHPLHYKQRKGVRTSFPVVTASQVDEREYVIQIITLKSKSIPLSVVLEDLEKGGFQVLNASAFTSSGKMVCYNLHLQVKETRVWECEMLSQELMFMYQNQEELQTQCFNVHNLRRGLQTQL